MAQREALFVQGLGPLKIPTQERHPRQGAERLLETTPIYSLPGQCCGFLGECRRLLEVALEQARPPQVDQENADEKCAVQFSREGQTFFKELLGLLVVSPCP